ncbi:MAG TPA: hypothetical protein VIT68_03990 [Candidatus Gracilibacteria bacterium]
MAPNAPGENFEEKDQPQSQAEEVDHEKISPGETSEKIQRMHDHEARLDQDEQRLNEEALTDGLDREAEKPHLQRQIELVQQENNLPDNAEFFEEPNTGELIVNIPVPEEDLSEIQKQCLCFYQVNQHGKLEPVADPYQYLDGDDDLMYDPNALV